MSGEATVRREVERRVARLFLAWTAHLTECTECQLWRAGELDHDHECDSGAELYEDWQVAARALLLSMGAQA